MNIYEQQLDKNAANFGWLQSPAGQIAESGLQLRRQRLLGPGERIRIETPEKLDDQLKLLEVVHECWWKIGGVVFKRRNWHPPKHLLPDVSSRAMRISQATTG